MRQASGAEALSVLPGGVGRWSVSELKGRQCVRSERRRPPVAGTVSTRPRSTVRGRLEQGAGSVDDDVVQDRGGARTHRLPAEAREARTAVAGAPARPMCARGDPRLRTCARSPKTSTRAGPAPREPGGGTRRRRPPGLVGREVVPPPRHGVRARTAATQRHGGSRRSAMARCEAVQRPAGAARRRRQRRARRSGPWPRLGQPRAPSPARRRTASSMRAATARRYRAPQAAVALDGWIRWVRRGAAHGRR